MNAMKVCEATKNVKRLKLLLVGFGNVGQKVSQILFEERERFENLKGLNVKVVGVMGRSKGSMANPDGLDMPELLKMLELNGKFDPKHRDFCTLDSLEAAQTLDYDVLIELSSLSVEQKGEPAVSHIKAAMNRHRHVVTANKGPEAFAFNELDSLAKEKGVLFLYETIVMDGAPIFNLAFKTMRGCKIKGLSGILNSTTNYILSCMERGESFESAVLGAQKKGLAEADPSDDINGWDAAVKIAALANILMDAGITPQDMEVTGIAGVTPAKAQEIAASGKRLKMIASAWRDEQDKVCAKVAVEALPAGHLFANVSGTGAALRFETDLMAPVLMIQESPDLYDTAYGVISDIIEIRENINQ